MLYSTDMKKLCNAIKNIFLNTLVIIFSSPRNITKDEIDEAQIIKYLKSKP